MKKQFLLKGLGCADCASKMERRIAKLPGIKSVSINFFTTKMALDADDGAIDEILSQTAKIVDKIEPGVKLVQV